MRQTHAARQGMTRVDLAYRFLRWAAVAAVTVGVSACGQTDGGGIAPAALPLSKDAMHLMSQKGMSASGPIFIRIFKEESELEVWKARDDGHFYHFKTYPICNWSGDLGPKIEQGDRQAPEGFYNVSSAQMNPNSNYYLSFNVGFPNAYDRVFGRSGSNVMVHGNCKSAGCYAMTDALVEEIYGIAREAFAGGQKSFPLHAYPFRMTDANMQRHKGSQWVNFWRTLKQGYDYFEVTRQPPPVAICSKQYVVNAKFTEGAPTDAAAPCPPFVRPHPELWVSNEEQLPDTKMLMAHVKAPGIKTRNLAAEQMFADGDGTAAGWDTTISGKVSAAAMGFNTGN